MINKSFRNNFTNDIINVKDVYKDVAVLQDGSKISTDALNNTALFTEITLNASESSTAAFDMMNVNPFSALESQIVNLDTSNMSDAVDVNPSVRVIDSVGNVTEPFNNATNQFNLPNSHVDIYPDDPAMEKMELAKKYNIQQKTDFVYDEEKFAPSEDGSYIQPQEQPRSNSRTNEEVQQNPIVSMFQGVKRPNEFNTKMEFNFMIPRLDFIEMMEDSYDVSIIEYLAQEITNSILAEPHLIKNKIEEEIRMLVYKTNNDTPNKPASKRTRAKKTKEVVEDVQVEKKASKTRSTRAKKVVDEPNVEKQV